MTDSTSPNWIVHLNGLENPEAGTSGFFYFWSFFFKKIARGRVDAPLTIVRPSQIRTCGFSASGSLRNELFTLSFIYTDIDPKSYQRIAVIHHIEKSYPVIAFLLASPIQTIKQAFNIISECRYTLWTGSDSIVMVITSQYLIEFSSNLFQFPCFHVSHQLIYFSAFLRKLLLTGFPLHSESAIPTFGTVVCKT